MWYLRHHVLIMQIRSDKYPSGKVSSVSTADDYPVEWLQLSQDFPFFGTAMATVGINPNGILQVRSSPRVEHSNNSMACSSCPRKRNAHRFLGGLSASRTARNQTQFLYLEWIGILPRIPSRKCTITLQRKLLQILYSTSCTRM
jgi:hypothetical protein